MRRLLKKSRKERLTILVPEGPDLEANQSKLGVIIWHFKVGTVRAQLMKIQRQLKIESTKRRQFERDL